MGKKDTVEQIQDEAREGYSLFDRLAESNHRTKTVTVYTDQQVGAELGYAVDEDDFGIKTGRRVRVGAIGELDALKERAAEVVAHGTDEEVESTLAEIEAAKKTLTAKIKRLQKSMQKDALVFTLQSVPEIAIKRVERQARKHLGIKGKMSADQQEDYGDEFTAQLLAASVMNWEDKKAGKKFSSLTVEEARHLKGFLPRGQFPVLDQAMTELTYEAAISNAAVDDVDF